MARGGHKPGGWVVDNRWMARGKARGHGAQKGEENRSKTRGETGYVLAHKAVAKPCA
jgi:hypothetical protein